MTTPEQVILIANCYAILWLMHKVIRLQRRIEELEQSHPTDGDNQKDKP